MKIDYRTELEMDSSTKIEEILIGLPGFARRYFDHLDARNASILTRKQYAYDMNQFFTYASGLAQFDGLNFNELSSKEILDNISIDDLHDYIKILKYYEKGDKKLKRSASAVSRKLSSLRSFYSYYQKLGEIHTNPAVILEKPKTPNKEIEALDIDQVDRLVSTVTDTSSLTKREQISHSKTEKRDVAIIKLLLGTGIRVSELVGIDTSDVDFTERSIRIVRKGGDEEPVYLNAAIIDAIKDYSENERNELLNNNDSNALFISMHHKRMTPKSVENLVKSYAKKAGLTGKITPHALRRSFGTFLYEQTNDIYLVADSLHHKSVETTQKHYAKMSKDHKRKASEISETLIK